MPEIVYYLLKFAISLAVVYLFYHFVLRRLTFYNWNRWYLMGYTILSFFFASINVTPLLQQNKLDNDRTILMIPTLREQVLQNSVTNTPEIKTSTAWSTWDWTLLVLGIGVGILLLQFLIRYFSYLRMRRKAELISDNGMRLYQVDSDIIPFSFGRSIFINPRLHESGELEEIIRHEFVHVRQRHSIDIIWTELLCVFSWYNPFAWLIRKAVRQNLEFIADNKVLENGIDKKQYQYLLVKVIGNNQFSIAQKFNFSSLKKRIAMMNKMKSAGLHLVKFLFILPLALVMLVAFRNKTSEQSGANDISVWSPFTSLEKVRVNVMPASVSMYDTTPLTEKSKLSRVSENFEITDKKAVINLKDGTVEKYDLTNPDEKKKFEENYGRIFHLKGGTGAGTVFAIGTGIGTGISSSNSSSNGEGDAEDCVVICHVACNTSVACNTTAKVVCNTAVEATVATNSISPTVAVSPVIATTVCCEKIKNVSLAGLDPITVIGSKLAENIVTPTEPARLVSTAAGSHVSVIGRHGEALTGKEEILLTISKSSTREQLEAFKTQMKEKGYELTYSDIVYNDDGKLTQIRGNLKSENHQGYFTAYDFSKVIIAVVKDEDRVYFKVDVRNSKSVI